MLAGEWEQEQRQWKAEGASTCRICLEFGHQKQKCPDEDSHFVMAYVRNEVEYLDEWLHLKAQNQLPAGKPETSPCHLGRRIRRTPCLPRGSMLVPRLRGLGTRWYVTPSNIRRRS
ncbi:UNVERIFIED_CONTAM: hypothetical protein FKN15_073522 [Acipenser sinensis]